MDTDISWILGLILIHETLGMSPSLTINPNPVDEGGHVDITCSYTKSGNDFNVHLYHGGIIVCSYFNKAYETKENYTNRIVHTPPSNYNSGMTITLTNITIKDNGTFTCDVTDSNGRLTLENKLDVYMPPRSMRVFMSLPPPYTESKVKPLQPGEKGTSYDSLHNVTCTFSMYPNITSALVWPYKIIHGNDMKSLFVTSVILKDGLYDITMLGSTPLTREDNRPGEKSLSCEVTWRRTNRKYSAKLETLLNVTFSGLSDFAMTTNGSILVENNSATYPICTWGSANPRKPIKWIFKDSTVSAANIGDKTALPSKFHYEAGEFHGQTTVSRLTVTRELSQREVSCCVTDGPSLYCKHSEVLDVRFPPTETAITASADGETMTLTCTTNSSRPHSNIIWDLPTHRQNDTTVITELITSEGKFGGNISSSILTLTVRDEDMRKPFTCRVTWNGEEIQSLEKNHTIGATTSTPLPASTSGDDPEGSHGAKKHPVEDKKNLIIGLAVGLGGAVILILAVVLVVVIVRGKRRKQRPQGRADNAGDKNPETAHDYETVDEELKKVPDKSQQNSMIEPAEPDYADIGNGNAYTETAQKTDSKPAPPVSDPPKSPPEPLSHDDEIHTYSQVNKSPSRRQKEQPGLPDVVSPGVKRNDPDSDEDPEGPPVSEKRITKLGEPAIVPAEAEQPPTDEQKHPEIKKSKPVVDKSKKPRKPGKKPEDPYSEIGDRTPNVVTQKSEPNYAEINPSQKKNVVPTPTERTEYGKVDFSQDHENDEDVTGDSDSD